MSYYIANLNPQTLLMLTNSWILQSVWNTKDLLFNKHEVIGESTVGRSNIRNFHTSGGGVILELVETSWYVN